MEKYTESVPSLNCNHSEAEVDKSTPGDIIIRASDTDILVMLLPHVHLVSSTVWVQVGTRGDGGLCYVNMTKNAAAIGQAMCAALLAYMPSQAVTIPLNLQGKERTSHM